MQISIDGLSKKFGGVVALQNVSLEIGEGEIIAVVGANGMGKTTLLQTLAGILAPSSGEVRYDEQVFNRGRVDLRRRFFFLSDTPQVFEGMTILEHIGMVVKLYEAEHDGIKEEILQLLKDFDLLPLIDTKLSTLSRGQRYKTALVAFLAVDPEVWIFDEPFASGIDPRGINAYQRRSREAIARGRTVIYSTQIIELAARFSNQICVLQNGSVEAFGPMEELRRNAPTGSILCELLNSAQSIEGEESE